MHEILKQPQYQPIDLADQVVVLFAGTNGYADDVPADKMADWEAGLRRSMEASHPEILREIAESKRITDETRAVLRRAVEAFKAGWQV